MFCSWILLHPPVPVVSPPGLLRLGYVEDQRVALQHPCGGQSCGWLPRVRQWYSRRHLRCKISQVATWGLENWCFFVKPKLYTVRILGRFIWGILPNKWWLGIAGRQEPMSGHFGLFVSNMFHFQATSRLVPTCSNIFQMYVSKLSPRLKDNSMTELWRPHHDVTIFDGEYCKGIRQSPAKWLNRSVHSNYIYGWWFGL